MACPGSVRLSAGIPNTTSDFAREGTAAHALAELALRKAADPALWIGTTVEGVEVTEDMADFVRVYTDVCRGVMSELSEHWIEHRFSLGALNPPAPMFGTADFVAYNATDRELIVCDLKYGQGVVVEVVDNKQLRYYALGAALSLDAARYPINTVVICVVQPRATHPDGVARAETIAYADLLAFAADLLDAARETTKPDAPLAPGSHCRFCPASGICPAQLAQAQEIARCEFDAMPLDVPPAPETLPDHVFADMLGKLHILEDWAAAMRAHAKARMERGEHVPGWKLVAKRAVRKWESPERVRDYMAATGFERDEYLDEKVKSPAQLEKLFTKKAIPAELVVVKQSTGTTMAPEHDPRPAVALSAGDDFAALSPAE